MMGLRNRRQRRHIYTTFVPVVKLDILNPMGSKVTIRLENIGPGFSCFSYLFTPIFLCGLTLPINRWVKVSNRHLYVLARQLSSVWQAQIRNDSNLHLFTFAYEASTSQLCYSGHIYKILCNWIHWWMVSLSSFLLFSCARIISTNIDFLLSKSTCCHISDI